MSNSVISFHALGFSRSKNIRLTDISNSDALSDDFSIRNLIAKLISSFFSFLKSFDNQGCVLNDLNLITLAFILKLYCNATMETS